MDSNCPAHLPPSRTRDCFKYQANIVYSLLKKKKKKEKKNNWSSHGQSNRLALLALFAVEMVASNLNATHPKEEGR